MMRVKSGWKKRIAKFKGKLWQMIREEVSARLLQTDVTRSYIKMWNPKYICNSDIVNLKQPQNFRIKLKWARAKSVKSSFYNSVAFFRI